MSEKIIYSKFSNERAPEYRIATEIICKDSEKLVRKRALSSKSLNHINKLIESESLQNQAFIGTKLISNRIIHSENGCVDFEFLETENYAAFLDRLLDNNEITELKNQIHGLFLEFEKAQFQDFNKTDDFIEIFGDFDFPKSCKCLKFSNIDLIFDNLFREEDKINIIDYEWCFKFPIPFEFIKWRIIHLYLNLNPKRLILNENELLDYFEFSNENIEKFNLMQENFDKYVWKNSFNLGKMSSLLAQQKVNLRTDLLPKIICSDLYYDVGKGLSEENKLQILKYPYTYVVTENIKSLRLDSGSSPCFVKINSIKVNDEELTFTTNAIYCENDVYFFNTNDPNIYINSIDIEKTYCFDLDIYSVSESVSDTITQVVNRMNDNISSNVELKKEITNFSNELTEERCKTSRLENDLSEKITALNELTNLNHELDNRLSEITMNLNLEIDKNRELDIKLLEINNELIKTINSLNEQCNINAQKEITIQNLNNTILSIYSSKSWKITKPLRWIMRKLKRQ